MNERHAILLHVETDSEYWRAGVPQQDCWPLPDQVREALESILPSMVLQHNGTRVQFRRAVVMSLIHTTEYQALDQLVDDAIEHLQQRVEELGQLSLELTRHTNSADSARGNNEQ